jgi:hypothetical protein
MPLSEEVIPAALAAEAEAARLWFAREQSAESKLTGIAALLCVRPHGVI